MRESLPCICSSFHLCLILGFLKLICLILGFLKLIFLIGTWDLVFSFQLLIGSRFGHNPSRYTTPASTELACPPVWLNWLLQRLIWSSRRGRVDACAGGRTQSRNLHRRWQRYVTFSLREAGSSYRDLKYLLNQKWINNTKLWQYLAKKIGQF